MIRQFAIAAALLLGVTMIRAEEPAAKTPLKPPSSADSAEVLAAQIDTRKAYVKAAEIALAAARSKTDKFEIDAAEAQLDIRKAELRETEVRLKEAKSRSSVGKAAPQQVAVFNMAAVMADYEKAKYEVYKLSKLKNDKAGKLLQLRAEHATLQQRIATITDATEKDEANVKLRELQRQFEDEERRVNKFTTEAASKVINDLYDDINEVVDEMAEANSYRIIFAYPDAPNAVEKEKPSLKELKLRPPAALPLFVEKKSNITDLVIQKLNTKFPALDEKGKKVDVSKLPTITVPAITLDKPAK